jgi:hypothetical protein
MIALQDVLHGWEKLKVTFPMKATDQLMVQWDDMIDMHPLKTSLEVDPIDLLSVCPWWHSLSLCTLSEGLLGASSSPTLRSLSVGP